MFEHFADEEKKMNQEKLAQFTSKVTEGIYCPPTDVRIQSVFNNYADGKDFLTFEQFLKFYRDSALSGPSKQQLVQNNLIALGYDASLKLKNINSLSSQKNREKSLRFKLANDAEFFEFLMKNFVDQNFDVETFEIIKSFTPNFDLILRIMENPIETVK